MHCVYVYNVTVTVRNTITVNTMSTFDELFEDEDKMREWSKQIINDYHAEQNNERAQLPDVFIACNKVGLIPHNTKK